MKNWQDRSLGRRLMASRVVQAFFFSLFILVGSRVAGLYQSERTVVKEELALKRELATLFAHRDELTAEIAALGTERGVEEEIRERYGVVKEGEKVINLVGEMATTTVESEPNSWWQRIWQELWE